MSRTVMTRIGRNAAFVAALAQRQLQASFALRGAFLLSAAAMLLNDLIFFTTWWLIMQRFGNVRGWLLGDVMCLYAVAVGGVGTCVIAFGGVHDLSRKIEEGDLDHLLTQPKSALFQVLASRTEPSGWGDVAASVGIFALSGVVTAASVLRFSVAVFCSAVGFAACGVVFYSLAFWVGRARTLSRSLWDFTLHFSMYPPALFGGPLKLILVAVIPAGVVTYAPVEWLRHPSPLALLTAVSGAALYAAFAVWLFHRGLRRYTSGNRFGVRA